MSTNATDKIRRADPTTAYAPGHGRPLAAYAVLTTGFTGLAGAIAAARAGGREIDRPGLADVRLQGLATQKVSRLIATDKVTSVLRAPFTRYQEPAGHGELEEAPRVTACATRSASCSSVRTTSQWVAGGLAAGHLLTPRTTRVLSAMWAAQAIADGVQLAYPAGEQQS